MQTVHPSTSKGVALHTVFHYHLPWLVTEIMLKGHKIAVHPTNHSFICLQFSAQQLKEQLEGQLNNNRDRMTGLQQDFENLNEDRVRLLDEIDDMKKRLLAAQQEKEAAQRKYQKEVLS